MEADGRRPEPVSDADKSPLLQIVSGMFLVIVALCVATRLNTKMMRVRRWDWEDYWAIAATVTALGYFVTVIVEAEHGLGKHGTVLSGSHLSAVLKADYAASLFFIATQAISKVAYVSSLYKLSHQSRQKALIIAAVLAGAWGISSLFPILFQCALPTPWDDTKHDCIDRFAFWIYFSAANIALELVLSFLTVDVIRLIQTSWSIRFLVIQVFGCRVLVVPAIACQLYYSYKKMGSADPTFDMWQPTLIIVILQLLSIITICIPFLRPFLESLESGLLRADGVAEKMKAGGTSKAVSGRELYDWHTSNRNSLRPSLGPSLVPSLGRASGDVREPRTSLNVTSITANGANDTSWLRHSHHSEDGLIRQTKAWDVVVE